MPKPLISEIQIDSETVSCLESTDSALIGGCKSGKILVWEVSDKNWRNISKTAMEYAVILFFIRN